MMRKRIINTMLLLLAVLTMPAQSSLWWIDSDYANRTIVAGGEELTIEIDISGLTPGVHVLNFRATTDDGTPGALHRRAFIVSPEADVYEYWIDDHMGQAQVVSMDTFNVDLTGLTAGLHYLNVRPRHVDGTQGAVSRRAFQVIPNITGYQWMFSSDSLQTRVNVEPTAELTLSEEPFDIPLSDGFYDISSLTPFVFTADSVLLVRQDTTMFTMQFFTDEGRYSDVQSTMVNISDSLCHALVELPLFGQVGLDKAAVDDYRCFRVSVPDSDAYALQTTQDCRLLLYNGQDQTLEFADSTSLLDGCELTLSTGSYYGILYNMGGTNDSTFISFRLLNNTVATPVITHSGNIIEISCATAQANIYYTLDGSEPDSMSIAYNGIFEVTHNCTIKAIALRENYYPSATDSLRVDWIMIGDAFFDGLVATVSGDRTLEEAFDSIGGHSMAAKTIAVIIWDKNRPITESDLQGLDNPNMLVYVANASLAPANRDNVIVGNDSTGYTAKNIKLTDVVEGNGNFYCPREFKAEMISYTHEYRQQTEIGVARGWETIALPFTVQTIMHEKNGLIAPFGNSASSKHFWLRQLTHHGLAQATQIEANTPYLISMPNNAEYSAKFNQAGRVTFSSQNVEVPVTQLNGMEAQTGAGDMVLLQPNFKGQSATAMIYALNVGVERDGHPEGSVFEANYRSVRPFEAFTVHHGNGPAPQFISVSAMNGDVTGIEDVRCKMSDGRGDNWYDLNGRRLQQKPAQKGVYLNNGRKVVVR